MGVFNAVLFFLFFLCYEETKYVPRYAEKPCSGAEEDSHISGDGDGSNTNHDPDTTAAVSVEPGNRQHEWDTSIPRNLWPRRFALITPTLEPVWPYFYRPFYVLFAFPAVLFAALQYAAGVIWLTIMANTLCLVFPLAPYRFTPQQIGFMSVGPFIGNMIGAVYGGVLSDWSIVFFSRRNHGLYEPEMRLYTMHLPALAMAGGLAMFGATAAQVCVSSARHAYHTADYSPLAFVYMFFLCFSDIS